MCVCVHARLVATDPFSLFLCTFPLFFFFFLTRPVYLLKLPTTNAPIAFLNKWVTVRHVVAEITATPTEMQPLGRKSGCTLCIPFKRRASSNTAFTRQRQGSSSRVRGWEHRFASTAAFFFLASSKCFSTAQSSLSWKVCSQPAQWDAVPLDSPQGFYTEQQWYVRANLGAVSMVALHRPWAVAMDANILPIKGIIRLFLKKQIHIYLCFI